MLYAFSSYNFYIEFYYLSLSTNVPDFFFFYHETIPTGIPASPVRSMIFYCHILFQWYFIVIHCLLIIPR